MPRARAHAASVSHFILACPVRSPAGRLRALWLEGNGFLKMEGFEGLVDHTDEETGATREETPWTSTDDTLARLDERARRGDEARARAREIRRGRLRGEDAKEEEEEEAADDDDADE